jgi:hypothetical protein
MKKFDDLEMKMVFGCKKKDGKNNFFYKGKLPLKSLRDNVEKTILLSGYFKVLEIF